MTNDLADDVAHFVALHRRAAELTETEREQYELLRARVQASQRVGDAPPPPRQVPDDDEPLF